MPLLFLAIIFWIVFAVYNGKKKQEDAAEREKKQREAAMHSDKRAEKEHSGQFRRPYTNIGPAVAPSVKQASAQNQDMPGPWACTCGFYNAQGNFCRQCGRSRAAGMSGSLEYISTEGMSLDKSPRKRGGAVRPSLKHVVEPVTESRHSHTESSMYGSAMDCEEEYNEQKDAYGDTANNTAYSVDMSDRDAVIQGVLYSEILGKPKALRSAR